MRTAIILTALLLAACDRSAPLIEREYVWVQEDGVGIMKGPITYIVRLELNGDTLTWRQMGVSTEGEAMIADWELPCSVFDEDNFDCSNAMGNFTAIMRNGELTSNYWGEDLKLKRRIRILGYGF